MHIVITQGPGLYKLESLFIAPNGCHFTYPNTIVLNNVYFIAWRRAILLNFVYTRVENHASTVATQLALWCNGLLVNVMLDTMEILKGEVGLDDQVYPCFSKYFISGVEIIGGNASLFT